MGTYIICQLLLTEDNRTVPLSSLKAKITDNLSEYEWSSYTEYTAGKEGLADKEFVSELLPKEEFIDFYNTEEELVFTVDDKTKIAEDEIIFEFDRFYNECGSKKINWESSLKSEAKALTLLNLNETVKTENVKKRITSLYFAHNPASSFMGGSEQAAYPSNDKYNLWYTYEIKKWDTALKKSVCLKGMQACSPNEAWEKYRLKIISFECAPPIENEFVKR